MKIIYGPYNYERQAYIKESAEKRRPEANQSLLNDKAESSKDSIVVNLSGTSKEMQIAKAAVSNQPDVRSEKVDALKKAIDEGRYEINAEQIADKIIGTAFNDRV